MCVGYIYIWRLMMAKQEHWISAAGCVYSIYYHFVWCTKYRRPVLVGEVAAYLRELHEEIAKKRQIILREQVINPDHVHLFITAHPVAIAAREDIQRLQSSCLRDFPS